MAGLMKAVPVVLQVALRKRKAAIDAGDAVAQARVEVTLTALKSNWLAVEYAAWQAAGFPVIP